MRQKCHGYLHLGSKTTNTRGIITNIKDSIFGGGLSSTGTAIPKIFFRALYFMLRKEDNYYVSLL
jgi:hypothetical protein